MAATLPAIGTPAATGTELHTNGTESVTVDAPVYHPLLIGRRYQPIAWSMSMAGLRLYRPVGTIAGAILPPNQAVAQEVYSNQVILSTPTLDQGTPQTILLPGHHQRKPLVLTPPIVRDHQPTHQLPCHYSRLKSVAGPKTT